MTDDCVYLLAALSETMRNFMMAAGVFILLVLFMMNARRKLQKTNDKSDTQLTPHERLEKAKQADGAKNDLRTMMVELEELSRDFGSKLDAKTIQLQKLVSEAEQKIAELQRLVDGGAAPPPGAAEPKIEPIDAGPDPLARSVYDLSDAGHDPGEIATKLSEPIGKVELILALRQ